jgi:fumarylacetoacetate (FAA) hydrolase
MATPAFSATLAANATAARLRLATLRDGSRDGRLALTDAALARCAPMTHIARHLREALDDWDTIALRLARAQDKLDASGWAGAEAFDSTQCMAPLPGPCQWADEAHGIDLEAAVAVITTDVPMGKRAADAGCCIALVTLVNAVSLRTLAPGELARGFGSDQRQPASHFAPVAVSPAALGNAWRGAALHLSVTVHVNGRWIGAPNAGEELVFNFGQAIEHLARTRSLGAGTIVGVGTVSDAQADRHPHAGAGDRVHVEAFDRAGQSVFGAIDQVVSTLHQGTLP